MIEKMRIVRKIRENYRMANETCRICLQHNDLISPCSCTHGYFHRECLNLWRLSHHQNHPKRFACEVCLSRYDYVVITPPSSRSSPISSPFRQNRRSNATFPPLTRYERLILVFIPLFTINLCGYVILMVYLIPTSYFASYPVEIIMFVQCAINCLMFPITALLFRFDPRCLVCSKHVGIQTLLGAAVLVSSAYATQTQWIIDDIICTVTSSFLAFVSCALNMIR